MSVFKIKKIEAGWLEGYLENDRFHKEFSYSDLTDFLGDLLEEIIFVIENKKEIGTVEAELEPGTECWEIFYDNKNFVISINDDGNDLQFIFNNNDFIDTFIKEIDNNLDKYDDNYLSFGITDKRTIDDLKKYVSKIKKELINE